MRGVDQKTTSTAVVHLDHRAADDAVDQSPSKVWWFVGHMILSTCYVSEGDYWDDMPAITVDRCPVLWLIKPTELAQRWLDTEVILPLNDDFTMKSSLVYTCLCLQRRYAARCVRHCNDS